METIDVKQFVKRKKKESRDVSPTTGLVKERRGLKTRTTKETVGEIERTLKIVCRILREKTVVHRWE